MEFDNYLPSRCDCGSSFTVEHALSCVKGGYPSIRHNEIRDLTANLLSEVCNNVCTEPELLPVTGENLTGASANVQPGARLDIAANGVWGGSFERTHFDVRVFNPHAPSNRHTDPQTVYRKHEQQKSGPTNKEFVKLNMLHSPHWFLLLPGV